MYINRAALGNGLKDLGAWCASRLGVCTFVISLIYLLSVGLPAIIFLINNNLTELLSNSRFMYQLIVGGGVVGCCCTVISLCACVSKGGAYLETRADIAAQRAQRERNERELQSQLESGLLQRGMPVSSIQPSITVLESSMSSVTPQIGYAIQADLRTPATTGNTVAESGDVSMQEPEPLPTTPSRGVC